MQTHKKHATHACSWASVNSEAIFPPTPSNGFIGIYMSHAGFQHPLPLPARVTVDRPHPSSALEARPPLLVGLVACGLTVSHNIIFHSPPYIWPACKCSQPVTIATNSRPLKQSPTAHHQSQPHSQPAQPPWPSHPPASHRASQPEIWDRTMGGRGGSCSPGP